MPPSKLQTREVAFPAAFILLLYSTRELSSPCRILSMETREVTFGSLYTLAF